MAETIRYTLPAITGGTDFTTDIWVVPTDVEDYTVLRVEVVSNTAITAQGGTNNETVTLNRVRAGSAAAVAALPLGTQALAQDTPVSLAVSNPGLQANDVLQLAVTHAGTGATTATGIEFNVEVG